MERKDRGIDKKVTRKKKFFFVNIPQNLWYKLVHFTA